MSFPPVYNPNIPYLGLIPGAGGMCPGKMIRVNGNTPPHCQRFALNIQCGAGVNPRDDIALHLNIRIPENCVVRNHLQGAAWGMEETGGGQPLQPGQPFQILVLCEPNQYKIALNGNHFADFPHRIPYQRATHLTIDGDVAVSMIGVEGGDVSFQQAPPPYSAPPPPQAQGYGVPGYGAPPPPAPYDPSSGYGYGYGNMAAMPGYQPQPQPQPQSYSSQPALQTIPGTFGNNAYATAPVPQQQHQQKEGSSFGKKALMYGLPLAGVGLGAYALGGGFSKSDDEADNDDGDDYLE